MILNGLRNQTGKPTVRPQLSAKQDHLRKH
jgi:hypothetical protein